MNICAQGSLISSKLFFRNCPCVARILNSNRAPKTISGTNTKPAYDYSEVQPQIDKYVQENSNFAAWELYEMKATASVLSTS